MKGAVYHAGDARRVRHHLDIAEALGAHDAQHVVGLADAHLEIQAAAGVQGRAPNRRNIIMKIAIGCDHGGYLLKQDILIWLEEHDYEFEDFGCYNTESVDYPVYGEKVARAVASGECDKGIVICTTGIGISMSANKVKGIRCALCGDSYSAEMTRRHNDANVLAMGAGIIGPNLAKKITEVFLTTEFEGGRHARRVGLLDNIQP